MASAAPFFFEQNTTPDDQHSAVFLAPRSFWRPRLPRARGLVLLGTFSHGRKRHPFDALISLGTHEPEGQPAGVVVGPRGRRVPGNRGANPQRPLLACLLPAPAVHHHANHHADRLPQPLGPPRVL